MSATIYDFTLMVKLLRDPPNRLREWRNARGMTQQALADAIDMKKNQVSRLETGERDLGLPRMRQIARVLGIAPGDLLNAEDSGIAADEREVIELMRESPVYKEALAGQVRTVRNVSEAAREFGHASAEAKPANV